MAENIDDAKNCPVCFEAYQVSGENVPKLLPCSHSLCKKCLKGLKPCRGEFKCPQCRYKWRNNRDENSFPENQYIVSLLQYKTEKEKEDGNKCPKHQRELNLFCNAPECKCLTCTKCMNEDHWNHEFLVVDVQKERSEALMNNIKSMKEDLESKREKLLASKKQVEVNNASSINAIALRKSEIIKKITAKINVKFDNLVCEVTDQDVEMKQRIDEQLRMLEYNLNMLEDISKDGQGDQGVMADEMISDNKVIVKFLKRKIETTPSKTETVKYMKYLKGNPEENPVEDVLKKLCGCVKSAKVDGTAEGTVDCTLVFATTFLSITLYFCLCIHQLAPPFH